MRAGTGQDERYLARGEVRLGVRRCGPSNRCAGGKHRVEATSILGDRESQAQRSVCRLTIVGGVRERLLVWRLGRWEYCAPEAPCRPLKETPDELRSI